MTSVAPELPIELFVDLAKCQDGKRFAGRSVFDCVGKELGKLITAFLDELGVKETPKVLGTVADGAYLSGRVYIAKGAVVEPTAFIEGPCYIGEGAQVRHGAYIRGNVFVGKGAVVGHTSEVKGSALFDDAKAAHFAYVGDAVLGRSVNLGAGTKLANLPLRRVEIRVVHPQSGKLIGSGLHKLSAIVGDDAQTGCNSVLSPGTLLMPNTAVMPCVHYRGTLKAGIAR